jgi:hypothetical protein
MEATADGQAKAASDNGARPPFPHSLPFQASGAILVFFDFSFIFD